MMDPGEELQKLIHDILKADPGVTDLGVGKVYDVVPDEAPERYVSFGPLNVFSDDTDCAFGGTYRQQLDVWVVEGVGDVHCKRLTGAIKRALHDRDHNMTDNALVEMLVPQHRVFRDPDGVTSHGVVIVEAMIEEA